QLVYGIEVLQVVGKLVYLLVVGGYVATTRANAGEVVGGFLKGCIKLVDATRSALYPLGELRGSQGGVRHIRYGGDLIAEGAKAIAEVADQLRTDPGFGQHFVERGGAPCVGNWPCGSFRQLALVVFR